MANLKIEQTLFRILAPVMLLVIIFWVKLGFDEDKSEMETALPQSTTNQNPPINETLTGCTNFQGDFKLYPHGFKWLSIRQPSCSEIVFNYYDSGDARAFKFGKRKKYRQGKWTLNRKFKWTNEKNKTLLEEFRNNHDEQYDCWGIQKYNLEDKNIVIYSDITCSGQTGTGDRYRKMVWVPKSVDLYPEYHDGGTKEEKDKD